MKEEYIEIGSRKVYFSHTKTGRLYQEVIKANYDIPHLSEYLEASKEAILFNMRAYNVMTQLVEGLMLSQSLTQRGQVVSVTFPEQKKVLQQAVDKMLVLMGKTINKEGQ